MLDARALITKHQAKGVLLDTNLLVLYLVGKINPRRILDFKRTKNYTIEDFHLLEGLVARCGKLFVTPHVLTQVSDLSALPGRELAPIRKLLRSVIEHADEYRDASSVVAADPSFERLGLADAAIAMASRHGLLVLTDDLDLQLALERRGMDALNFNHVRPLAWGRG